LIAIVERLRDKRPVPGSAEAILIDAVKSQRRVETSRINRARIYAGVLDRQRPRVGHARGVRQAAVALGLLLAASMTAASTLGARRTHRRPPPRIDAPPETAGASEAIAHKLAAPAVASPARPSRPMLKRRRDEAEDPDDPTLVVDGIRTLRHEHD
jgi:hypothetical protein